MPSNWILKRKFLNFCLKNMSNDFRAGNSVFSNASVKGESVFE